MVSYSIVKVLHVYVFAAPSGPPANITVSSITSTGFILHWDPPTQYDQNGYITHYVIRVLEVETENVTEYVSTTMYLSLSSLHPAYTYNCSVAAHTVEIGPFSNYYVMTRESGQQKCNAVVSIIVRKYVYFSIKHLKKCSLK